MRILQSKNYSTSEPMKPYEISVTCTACKTVFAVSRKGASLVTSNEMERSVECTICGNEIPLSDLPKRNNHGEGSNQEGRIIG